MDTVHKTLTSDFVAATNLMAISIANRNQAQANETLSDAIGIALMFGAIFGVFTYFAAPSILQAMTGAASASIVEPASTYVQIRYYSWKDDVFVA